jgi:hypothetical protein
VFGSLGRRRALGKVLQLVYGEIVFPNAGVHPQAEFIAGFHRQARAFGLIGVGLALQFIGNFAK